MYIYIYIYMSVCGVCVNIIGSQLQIHVAPRNKFQNMIAGAVSSARVDARVA